MTGNAVRRTSANRLDQSYRAIAAQIQRANPDLGATARHSLTQAIALGLLALGLAAQRRLVSWESLAQLATSKEGVPLLRAQLMALNQRWPIDFPVEAIAPDVTLDAGMVREIWSQLGLNVTASHPPLPVERLGQVYEHSLVVAPVECAQRKRQGVYYTPPDLVQYAVRQTLARCPALPTVVDPACGGGAFLLAVFDELRRRLPSQAPEARCLVLKTLYGIDLDAQAVAVTRLSLLLKWVEGVEMTGSRGEGWQPEGGFPDLRQTICCGNALVEQPEVLDRGEKERSLDWGSVFPEVWKLGGFDVVLGNPPYLDAEQMSRYRPALRRYCTRRYRSAIGNWDLFCVFIEKALELCRPGGLHSFVVPNKLIAADYTAPVRSLLSYDHRLHSVRDYSRVPVFSAAVYPLVYVVQKTPPDPSQPVCYEQMRDLSAIAQQVWLDYATHLWPPEQPWRLVVSSAQVSLFARLQEKGRSLGHWATVTGAATVAEAYAIQALVQEGQPESEGLRLVNSGTLDRYWMAWGQKPLRYLGDRYLRPVIAPGDFARLPPKRLHQATQPKIVIAGMTRHLECALDAQGRVLAGKSTSVVQSTLDLRLVLGVLNSHLINQFFVTTFAGNSLQGGYLRIGPPQLRCIPLPPDIEQPGRGDRLVELVDQMQQLHHQRTATTPEATPQPDDPMAELDHQIDLEVYQLYHLSDRDIETIGARFGT